ncbi:hypothetical protein BKA58DRAFT_159360 [Alternaria rosae]|uniref:uncharacterized protein n=1 Tax=Alternaria rosae TaxID=1187941 RepID=UPI001E8D2506|nr:uncharacterized protein BKA58DRAFT_159360 [Alternaria rosae]KAH6873049.1 hypothetical protein BKA58DRAFT_159360 [Alternaria rosae]
MLPRLHPQASQLFAKITPDSFHARWYGSHDYETDPTLSVNELEAFINIYQQFRLVRAETLAAELYRLADIYETHPTRLKQPFDTRIQVPNAFNAQHVPTQMRHEARKRVRRAKNARSNSREVKPFRFTYPPLVPYESQLQSFCDGLEDIANKQGIDGERSAPVEIVEKCQAVVQNAPDWAHSEHPYTCLGVSISRLARSSARRRRGGVAGRFRRGNSMAGRMVSPRSRTRWLMVNFSVVILGYT